MKLSWDIYHESTRQNGERKREKREAGRGVEREVRGEKRAKSKSQTIITKKRRGGKEERERERGRGEDQKRIIRISNKNPFDHTGKLN